jgi:hypothetical protein
MKVISRSHPVNDWHNNEVFSELEHIAVYRKEPAIKIVRNTLALNDNFREPWLSNLYPDQRTSTYNISVQFNGNELLKRTILLIDGGRVYIPMPRTVNSLETTQFELAICQVLNGSSAYDTAYYFKQSKIKVTDSIVEKA